MNTTYAMRLKKQTTTVEFEPSSTGLVTCQISLVTNARANVIVSDLDEEFMIWSSVDEDSQIVAGDEIFLSCGATRFLTDEVSWYRDDERIRNSSGSPTQLTMKQERSVWHFCECIEII